MSDFDVFASPGLNPSMRMPVHGGYPGTPAVRVVPVYDGNYGGICAMCKKRSCECAFGPYRPVRFLVTHE